MQEMFNKDLEGVKRSQSMLNNVIVKVKSEVAQSYPTLSDPMDCSLPGFSIHGILQARVPEWGAIALSGMNNALTEIKNILEGINSRITEGEDM